MFIFIILRVGRRTLVIQRAILFLHCVYIWWLGQIFMHNFRPNCLIVACDFCFFQG
jgi:hypothetical protein